MDATERDELAALAKEKLNEGQTDESLKYSELLIAEYRANEGDESESTLTWRAFRARVLTEARSYLEAERELDEVLRIRSAVEGITSPSAMRVRGNLARVMAFSGRTNEALLAAQQLLEDRRTVLGEEHPETLDSEGHIAHFTYLAGDPEVAAELYASLLEKRRRILGDEHPSTIQTEHNLVAVESAIGELEDLTELRELAKGNETTLGPDHVDTVNTYGILAERLVEFGEYAEGYEIARHVQLARERMLGSNHVRVQTTRHIAARANAGLGNYRETFDELRDIWIQLDLHLLGADSTAIQIYSDIVEYGCVLGSLEIETEDDLDLLRVAWRRLNALRHRIPADSPAHQVLEEYEDMFLPPNNDDT